MGQMSKAANLNHKIILNKTPPKLMDLKFFKIVLMAIKTNKTMMDRTTIKLMKIIQI